MQIIVLDSTENLSDLISRFSASENGVLIILDEKQDMNIPIKPPLIDHEDLMVQTLVPEKRESYRSKVISKKNKPWLR